MNILEKDGSIEVIGVGDDPNAYRRTAPWKPVAGDDPNAYRGNPPRSQGVPLIRIRPKLYLTDTPRGQGVRRAKRRAKKRGRG
jgi:hypothetical protein